MLLHSVQQHIRKKREEHCASCITRLHAQPNAIPLEHLLVWDSDTLELSDWHGLSISRSKNCLDVHMASSKSATRTTHSNCSAHDTNGITIDVLHTQALVEHADVNVTATAHIQYPKSCMYQGAATLQCKPTEHAYVCLQQDVSNTDAAQSALSAGNSYSTIRLQQRWYDGQSTVHTSLRWAHSLLGEDMLYNTMLLTWDKQSGAISPQLQCDWQSPTPAHDSEITTTLQLKLLKQCEARATMKRRNAKLSCGWVPSKHAKFSLEKPIDVLGIACKCSTTDVGIHGWINCSNAGMKHTLPSQ